jgi:VanZ family protein
MNKSKAKILRIILRIVLPILCIATLAFIFSNSLRSGNASSAQSGSIVNAVQKIVGVFAPNSWLATATGEAKDKIHAVIRTLAHFSEFALLGALFIWCYFSYTSEKRWLYLPVCTFLLVPVTDEFLQTLTATRAGEMADIAVDMLGGVCGMLFATVTIAIGVGICLHKKSKKTKNKNTPKQGEKEQ